MRKLIVSFGTASPAIIDSVRELTWTQLCKRLTDPPPEAEDKAERGWFCPVEFVPPYRDSENFYGRHALTFDFDMVDPWTWDMVAGWLTDQAYLMYTTFSHTEDQPRFRLVLPLSRAADYDEFQAVSRKIGEDLGIENMARESHVPSQMMYLPTTKYFTDPIDRFQASWSTDGAWIDVDATLARYADWTDHTSWPHRAVGDGVHKGTEEQIPPDQKPGAIGEFCRQYDVPAAILAFELPYEPTANPERYTYTAGSRPEGALLYDDGAKLHSHHDTDPARGQHNAFDLVRLHHFGHLDGPEFEGKPITEAPSYAAMLALVAEDPAVAAVRAYSEFDALPPEEAPPAADEPDGGLARRLAEVFRNPTKPRWLIRDEIERGVIAVMAGPRGSYKSFLALDWAMQVAIGGSAVYVVSAEGGDFDRRARAWCLAFAPDRSPEDIPLYVVERRLDLAKPPDMKKIIEDCENFFIEPQLMILDTWSKLSGGLDENDNTAVKQFIGRVDLGLKRRFDTTVLLIAHTGHSDAGRPRGASAFAADTDAEYIISRRDGTNIVSVSRERFKASPVLPPLSYESEVIELGYDDDEGIPVTSLVMRKVDYRLVGKSAQPRGTWNIAAYRALNQLVETTGSANEKELYRAIINSMPGPDQGEDDRSALARRAVGNLIAHQFAYRRDGQISLTEVMHAEEEFEYLD